MSDERETLEDYLISPDNILNMIISRDKMCKELLTSIGLTLAEIELREKQKLPFRCLRPRCGNEFGKQNTNAAFLILIPIFPDKDVIKENYV